MINEDLRKKFEKDFLEDDLGNSFIPIVKGQRVNLDVYELLEWVSSQLEPLVSLPSRTFGEWVDVKKALPKVDETVLCYSEFKDIDGDVYKGVSLGKRFTNYTRKIVFLADVGPFAEMIKVIKWMPLPKP